jgi:protein-disulfide isomerase
VSDQKRPKTGKSGGTLWCILVAVAGIAVGTGALAWYRGEFAPSQRTVTGDVDPAALLKEGPLPDLWLGNVNAPNAVIEYASMTCPHCAQFQNEVFPALKSKYIDSGHVRYALREFPLDGLAAAASMLARCAGDGRYYAMIDGLFATQETWAIPDDEGRNKLLQIARQAGFSKKSFDKCLGNKDLLKRIVEARKIAHEKFGVDSTPTFFINGKRLTGDHQMKDFDAAFAAQRLVVPERTAQTSQTPAKKPKSPSTAEATRDVTS